MVARLWNAPHYVEPGLNVDRECGKCDAASGGRQHAPRSVHVACHTTRSGKVSTALCFPTAAGAAPSTSADLGRASTCVRNLTSAGRSSIFTEESSRSAPSMTPAECRCTHVWMRTRAFSMGTAKFLGAEAQIRKDVKNRHRELARLQARVCLRARVCVHASQQI